MVLEKRPARELTGKLVVTKEGKRIGIVKDLTFEARSGELIQIVVTNPTSYALSLNLEKARTGELLIPFSSIIAVGDFVVVSEEDMR
ncbi:MAG: PRC-barrel domain-containing protein [Candidatus Pacearchaeota archaeon]